MFCYSDNVDKELKYNIYKSVSSIDSHAFHRKEDCSSEKEGIQSLENLQRRYFGDNLDSAIANLQSIFCASITQPKETPTNLHLLINIHHLRFSLGYQCLPRLHQSLKKPPASTPK